MITHLKERAEFYALCLEHGEENVEWCLENEGAGRSSWFNHPPDFDKPSRRGFEFRLRPKTVRIPEAEIPEEDRKGKHFFYVSIGQTDGGKDTTPASYYRTAEDRDKVVAAMLARVKR